MATPSTSTTSASSPSPSSSTDKKALATASTADFRASATGLKRDGETGEAVHTIVSGHKCWRIMKGKDEAVWPPVLEKALIEGSLSNGFWPPAPEKTEFLLFRT